MPHGVRVGVPRQCFRNAARLVLRKPQFYTYVEGPAAVASGPAPYSVTCNAAVVSTVAKVSPATQMTTSCTAAAPSFTFSGTITDNQAGTVSYHWSLPSGNGPTQTVTFAAGGTEAVTAATYKPASDTASGSGEIVVTSPAGVSSNAAAFKLDLPGPGRQREGGGDRRDRHRLLGHRDRDRRQEQLQVGGRDRAPPGAEDRRERGDAHHQRHAHHGGDVHDQGVGQRLLVARADGDGEPERDR